MCDKCNILYAPEDKILYCLKKEERQCPICNNSLYSGKKEYFEKKNNLKPIKAGEGIQIDKIDEDKDKKWWKRLFS